MDLNKVKKIVNDFFKNLGENIKIKEINFNDENKTLKINLSSANQRLLIGKNGEILLNLQNILKKIIRKKINTDFYLDLDLNNYKKNRENYLKDLAKRSAEEALILEKEIELEPMPAYERRIIHLEILKERGVESFSIGERDNRRIIIRPKKTKTD